MRGQLDGHLIRQRPYLPIIVFTHAFCCTSERSVGWTFNPSEALSPHHCLHPRFLLHAFCCTLSAALPIWILCYCYGIHLLVSDNNFIKMLLPDFNHIIRWYIYIYIYIHIHLWRWQIDSAGNPLLVNQPPGDLARHNQQIDKPLLGSSSATTGVGDPLGCKAIDRHNMNNYHYHYYEELTGPTTPIDAAE